MAIRTERYATSDGRELVRTFSDDGKKIANENGVVYDDAIDPKGHGHRYSETDEKVDVALEHPMIYTGCTYIGTDDPDEPTEADKDAAFAASEWRSNMTKAEFEKRVNAAQTETHDALATIWENLNHGQQQKLLKNAEVVAVLKRYGVIE